MGFGVHLMDVAELCLWFQVAAPHGGCRTLYFLGDFCSHLAVLKLPQAWLCVQQSCNCSRDIADVSYKWLQVGTGGIYKPCLGGFKYLVYCAVKKKKCRIITKLWGPNICKSFFDEMPSNILVLTVLTAKWHRNNPKISIYKESGMRKQKEGNRDLC